VIWFALACAAILPVALDGLVTRPDPSARSLNRAISTVGLAALAVAFIVTLARPASWFAREWPEEQVAAVRAATRSPDVRLYATDGTADWLLWRIPDLRGRIAYDVRFELYDRPALDAIARYGRRAQGWERIVDGYRVVLVDERAHLVGLERRGAKALYGDDSIVVLTLPT
jgi:hypothetical protein